jgi:4-amino-4-deoxy-L-arabinose transferase-like glycosyltransferase
LLEDRQAGNLTGVSTLRMFKTPTARAGALFGFAVVLGLAAAIRILCNNVSNFVPADETVYLRFARTVAQRRAYPDVVRMFVDDSSLWIFPNPLRWSYIVTSALYCTARGGCRYRTLATLSTVSGIVAVGLTSWLGVRLFDRRSALVATALMATAPLQLALGRHALADEFFCAVVLASVVAMIEWLRSPRPAWLIAWIVLTTLAFAAKEHFLLIYPVVLSVWWVRERKVRWVWAVPPLLFFAVFCALAGDMGSFFRIGRILVSVQRAPYVTEFQSGPPQRLLIDFVAIAPLVTIAFIAAAFHIDRRATGSGQFSTLLLAAGILVVHSLVPSKNLRFVVASDPFMRLLVASWLPATRFTAVALVGNAVVELTLFYVIFIRSGVYDPVTSQLLRALGIVP